MHDCLHGLINPAIGRYGRAALLQAPPVDRRAMASTVGSNLLQVVAVHLGEVGMWRMCYFAGMGQRKNAINEQR